MYIFCDINLKYVKNKIKGIGPRKQQQQFVGAHQETYEPPAAIQNAMMTKDKKPFTYTPGMGGKLDLSQIRSPRMARRVAKNAEDEGIEGPPKSTTVVTSPVLSPNQPNIYSHPQVAVPVFPANMPQTTTQLRNTINPNNRPQPGNYSLFCYKNFYKLFFRKYFYSNNGFLYIYKTNSLFKKNL